MRFVFVEPPKKFWFVMGEYLPPPTAAPRHLLIQQVQEEDIQISGKPEPPETAEEPHLRRVWRVTPYASVIISLAGVALVAAFLHQPSPIPSSSDAGLYIWGLFSTLCLLGASATLFPHLCGRVAHRPEELSPLRTSTLLGVRVVHGHHRPCVEFQGHEFKIKGKTFCAGCAGLLLGASTALVITTLHLVFRFTPPPVAAYIGLCCVVLSLFHIPLRITGIPLLRSIFNAVLVMGFSLVLIGVDNLGNFEFNLVVIGLCVFWMFTRIQLSNWDHERICRVCGFRCEGK